LGQSGVARVVVIVFVAGCGSKTGLEVPEVDGGPCAAAETCNDLDDDCDGTIDDGLACFFLDGAPIEAIETRRCGADWYSYGVPDSQSGNPRPEIRRRDQVVVAIQHGARCDGASVGVITDIGMSGVGGELVGSFSIEPATSAGLLVSDEPRECEVLGDGIVVCTWVWQACCTDGVLIGPFTEGCVNMTLSGPIGVENLFVHDGVGRTVTREFGVPFEICTRIRPAVP
jgi:hypothetical protein